MSTQGAIVFVTTAGSLVVALAGIGLVGGIRLNLTPSERLGIWRIETLSRGPLVRDLVFICPPSTPPFEEAWQRGYLRRGLCAGGFAPLIKTIAALPGQRIAIGDTVKIDGAVLGASRVRMSLDFVADHSSGRKGALHHIFNVANLKLENRADCPWCFRKERAAVEWGLFAIGVGAGDPYRQISEPHFDNRQSAIDVIGVLFLRGKGGCIEISGLSLPPMFNKQRKFDADIFGHFGSSPDLNHLFSIL